LSSLTKSQTLAIDLN